MGWFDSLFGVKPAAAAASAPVTTSAAGREESQAVINDAFGVKPEFTPAQLAANQRLNEITAPDRAAIRREEMETAFGSTGKVPISKEIGEVALAACGRHSGKLDCKDTEAHGAATQTRSATSVEQGQRRDRG